MAERNQSNTTNYEHPQESNLLNLHKAMEYDADGKPRLRVTSNIEGDIIIEGDVNIPGTVTVNSTPKDPVHTHITEVGTSGILTVPYMPIGGEVDIRSLPEVSVFTDSGNTLNIAGEVTQGTSPWVISKDANANSALNPIYVDTGLTIPPVFDGEIKNDSGNPIPISKNTSTNSSTNPIYVSNEGSTVVVGDLPAASLTAFDEPFAVGITPVIQADVMYGLDPDVWITTQLNNGTVTVTENTTWQVQSGTTAGGYARLATAAYMSYQPGQGSMFRWTAAFTTTDSASTNPYPTKNSLGIDDIVQNTGPIDREDGYSFGYSGNTSNNASRKIGILHRRAGRAETRALTITTAPTGSQTAVEIGRAHV